MKKILIFLVLLINTSIIVLSQPDNYANGNGTIIDTKIEGNVKWVFRKHIQCLQLGDFATDINLYVHSEPDLTQNNIITKLETGDCINITQVAEVTIEDKYHVWLNIKTDNNISGWLYYNRYEINNTYAQYAVPYFNNRWEIISRITIQKRIWTIRKMIGQVVSIWANGVYNIRDNPGTAGTNVISEITLPVNESPLVIFSVIAATEETDVIDGINDRWLKINYNGIEGWIFGGYTDVERGGPKYYFPENIIGHHFGWKP